MTTLTPEELVELAETDSTEGPLCPYCARQFTADENRYWELTKMECDDCGRTFDVEVCVETTWYSKARASQENSRG